MNLQWFACLLCEQVVGQDNKLNAKRLQKIPDLFSFPFASLNLEHTHTVNRSVICNVKHELQLPFMIERRKLGRASINWPLGSNSGQSWAELSLCLSQIPDDGDANVDVDAMIMISKTNKRCCFCRCSLQQPTTWSIYLAMHQLVRLLSLIVIFLGGSSSPDPPSSHSVTLSRLAFVSGPFDDHLGWLYALCLFLISLPLSPSPSLALSEPEGNSP